MFCGNCGKQIIDEADFCPACGAKVQKFSDSQNTGSNNTNINQAQVSTASKRSKKNLVIGLSIGGGVFVLLVVVCIIIIFVLKNNTENKLHEALASSWITQYGLISNNYVNDSDYVVDECIFKSAEISGNKTKFNFTATISNDNFRTEVEGYALANSDLSIVDDFKVEHKNTVPIKGVDAFYDSRNNDDSLLRKNRTTESGGQTYILTGYKDYYKRSESSRNVTSDLKDNNGVYTSEVSGELVVSYWFVDDIADAKAKFKFDNNEGWKRDGDVSLSNKRSEYKTSGKTFTYSKADHSKGPKEYSITLGDVQDGVLTFSYSLSFIPKRTQVGEGDTYRDIVESGTVSGKISHDWDTFKFNCEGVCSSNSGITMNVEYKADQPTYAKSSDEEYTLLIDVDIKSNVKYYYNTKWTVFYIIFEETSLLFEEKK